MIWVSDFFPFVRYFRRFEFYPTMLETDAHTWRKHNSNYNKHFKIIKTDTFAMNSWQIEFYVVLWTTLPLYLRYIFYHMVTPPPVCTSLQE